jgi:hypothetical protein
VRHLRKKLQQIEALEARAAGGEALNAQQAFKAAQRPQVRSGAAAILPAYWSLHVSARVTGNSKLY